MSAPVDALTSRLSTSLNMLRFDGKNYPIWKVRMRAYLQSNDLWEVVEKATDGSASSGKKAAEEEETKRKKAYSALVLSLGDAQLQMVMNVAEGNPHAVWKELSEHYEPRNTMASKAHTRGMLHKTRMQRGESFDLYRSRVLELVTRLRSVGEIVSEGELIYVLLEGLPEAYANVKQTLEMNDALKIADIVKHLRDFEEKETYKSEQRQEETAHFARARKQFQQRTDGEKNSTGGSGGVEWSPRCSVCKSTDGHTAWECKWKKGGPHDCHRCGQAGHEMRFCPEKNGKKEGEQRANMATKEEEEWSV